MKVLEIQIKYLPLQPQNEKEYILQGIWPEAGPFVYRLGREIFIL